MKFSAALSLAVAAPALAKAVHNVYPAEARRSAKLLTRERGNSINANANAGVGPNVVTGISASELAALGLSGFGITQNTVQEVIILWINGGGGAATTVVNPPVTTTVTVTAGGGQAAGAGQAAATSAVAAVGGEAGTTTAPLAASSVAGVAGAVTHTVSVGGPAAKLTFVPSEVKAAIGDTVIFTFLSQNHTATQSSFDNACEPLAGGMDSGFQPNKDNTVNPPPQVAMQVMVDTPLWFYCRQAGHCGKGMTFSINPTAAKTQALFQAGAIAKFGAGAGSAITGSGAGNGTAPAAGGGAAAPSATATLGGAAASATVAAGAAATNNPSGIVSGVGTLANGECQCAVICTIAAFPAVAQGAGAFGGQSGAIPNSMIGA